MAKELDLLSQETAPASETSPSAQPAQEALLAAEEISKEPPEKVAEAYLVLARKYRPLNFTQLIGQEAMVRTLGNAFERARIPHAIMLTGMRGVGKTTSARIIARALNYTLDGKPTTSIEMPEITPQCRDILESRHPDVIEIDAASRTGISDIREIIDSLAYRPVMARKKVYIIDEVHMLSTAAFNGLLKTLEEPPAHVMFIFATTEIRKVPVTILSRCQRFDLRRLTLEETHQLLQQVLEKENLAAEENALLLLSRAAEGSARDALSLLDQAIAYSDESGGTITEESVKTMLGLAGRAELLDLFEHIIGGNPQAALSDLQKRFDYGADPLLILGDCADLTHFFTRHKLAGATQEDYQLASNDRARAAQMVEKLSLESLALIWQMLLKGLEEVRFAPNPYKAAEMVLVRISHAQTFPTMGELAAALEQEASAETKTQSSAPPKETSAVNEVLAQFPGAKVVGN